MATRLSMLPTSQQTRTLWILIAFCAWLPMPTSADTFNCPPYVTASSATVVEVPPVWNVSSQPNKLQVVSAGFSDGQPSDMAYLKPYETQQKGRMTVVRWKFEGPYPQGKWLSCAYEGGLVSLARELPQGISECMVTYEKTRINNMQPRSITCK